MNILKNRRIGRFIVLSTGILVLLIGGGSLYHYNFSADKKLRDHDVAVTNREMTAARNTLIPLLKSLGIRLEPQNPASCSPGDPSLYAHSCGTQSEALWSTDLKLPQDANLASQNMQALDKKLKADGWIYNSNDFRSQGNQPVATWPDTLRAYGALVAYQKGTCYFEINLMSAVTQERYRTLNPGVLSCEIASGPPTSI